MSNNAPDYEDNLVFPPEMTWKELVEKAKKLRLIKCQGVLIKKIPFAETMIFNKAGVIRVSYSGQECYQRIAENRTPAQMYQIMKALED